MTQAMTPEEVSKLMSDAAAEMLGRRTELRTIINEMPSTPTINYTDEGIIVEPGIEQINGRKPLDGNRE